MEWFDVKGTGKLVTYSTLAFGPKGFEGDLPYTIALVDYGDYKVFGRIAGGIAESELSIGMAMAARANTMADGRVSYSGRMGGYGWLVIIDHPELNLYSLYGHLSPSRWSISPGALVKGELIGYIGDSDEKGGPQDVANPPPVVPHIVISASPAPAWISPR